VEGCGSNGGWERGECVFCEGLCVGRCRSSWRLSEPDGSVVVVKIRAPALLVCLGGGIRDAQACEEVGSFTVG
jgi:hypothetical protein